MPFLSFLRKLFFRGTHMIKLSAFLPVFVVLNGCALALDKANDEKKKEEKADRKEFASKLVGDWTSVCENGGSDKSSDSTYSFDDAGQMTISVNNYAARDCDQLENKIQAVTDFDVEVATEDEDKGEFKGNVKFKFIREEMLFTSSLHITALNLAKKCGYDDWEADKFKEIESGSDCFVKIDDDAGTLTIKKNELKVLTTSGTKKYWQK